MSNIFQKIKSFFVEREKKPFNQFCSEYLRIKAELLASDVNVTGPELNFKITWHGSVVPFWLSSRDEISQEKIDSKIQDSISIIAAGLIFGLNLVEISQELKKSQGLI